MLASAVPASQGDGAAILHQVARELIQPRLSDAELLPARELPRDAGAEALPGMDHPSRELTAEAPPVSTLAEAASQSVETSRTRRRWAMIAAAGLTALLAGGATAFTITQLLAPAGTARSAAAPSQSGTAAARPPAVAMAPRVVSAAPPASTTGEPRAGAGSALPADSVRSADDAAHVTAPPPADPPSPATPAATESSRPAAEPMHDTAQPAADPARATASPGRAHVAQPVADPSRSKPPSAADNARPAPIPAEPARSGEPLRSPAGMPGSPSGATRPSSGSATAAVRKGELAIIVRPWALIWLNGKSLGQTPYRETIPAGRYRLRIANDDAGKDETTLVTVTPDQTTTIQRSW
jgi:serine/threonine-protein kinase